MRGGTIRPHMTRRSLRTFLASGLLAAMVAACAAQASTPPTRLTLRTLNGSGVTGSVTLTAVEEERTLVVVEVDAAGHADMPAHIHPGTCDELVPQPRYPLANVVDGRSTTEVNASLDDLLAGDVALNLHASNQEMQLYTACVELR
jgi:hypothetical protein